MRTEEKVRCLDGTEVELVTTDDDNEALDLEQVESFSQRPDAREAE